MYSISLETKGEKRERANLLMKRTLDESNSESTSCVRCECTIYWSVLVLSSWLEGSYNTNSGVRRFILLFPKSKASMLNSVSLLTISPSSNTYIVEKRGKKRGCVNFWTTNRTQLEPNKTEPRTEREPTISIFLFRTKFAALWMYDVSRLLR